MNIRQNIGKYQYFIQQYMHVHIMCMCSKTYSLNCPIDNTYTCLVLHLVIVVGAGRAESLMVLCELMT